MVAVRKAQILAEIVVTADHPALILTTPITPFSFAKKSYSLGWHACDPDGADYTLLAAS